ncbi:hypothetical protein ACP3W1_27855, partial [Salmonella enterica]|uniref:hypothetical protein n=1 Tax=Salmonella enterica TaxID=28901 RepID=UPI003CF3C46B
WVKVIIDSQGRGRPTKNGLCAQLTYPLLQGLIPLSRDDLECSIKTATLRGNIEPPALSWRSRYVSKRGRLRFYYQWCG